MCARYGRGVEGGTRRARKPAKEEEEEAPEEEEEEEEGLKWGDRGSLTFPLVPLRRPEGEIETRRRKRL